MEETEADFVSVSLSLCPAGKHILGLFSSAFHFILFSISLLLCDTKRKNSIFP